MITEEDFKKKLADALYKTTRRVLGSSNVNAITYLDMFDALPKKEAQTLLDISKKFSYFYPDREEQYQELINKKKN